MFEWEMMGGEDVLSSSLIGRDIAEFFRQPGNRRRLFKANVLLVVRTILPVVYS